MTRTRRYRTLVIGTRVVIIAALLGLWQWLTTSGTIDPFTLPAPGVVVGALDDVLSASTMSGDLARTAKEFGLSALIGITAGFTIGGLLFRFRAARAVLEPFLASMFAIPLLVFYPILLVLLGLGSAPIVVLTTIAVVVPVALSTVVGLLEVNPVVLKLGRSMHASRRQLLGKIMLPATAPIVFPGVQLGITFGFVSVIGAQFLMSDGGLGYRIASEYEAFNYAGMWALIVVVCVVMLVIVGLMKLMERRIRRDL